MSKRIVFNVSFFELVTDMYWCLFGNSGSIASKLSIIAINPGHFYVKSSWLSRFYCRKAYLSSLPLRGSIPQHMVLRYLISFHYVIGQENAFAQICSGANILQNCENWGVNVGKCLICLAIYTPSVFWYANVSFTIFAPYLLLSFYIFATYLRGANLCKSIFFLPVGKNAVLSLCCSRKRKIVSWVEGDRSKMGWCVGTSHEECNRKILFSTKY